MLHLIQSNKMEVLAETLISCFRETAQQGHSIFEPDQVLVQSPGMSQWLKIKIAESLGIAANIDFPLPSSFIWQLYRQHIQGLPEQSAFTKPNMAWKIMSLLPTLLEQDEFAPIKRYLADDQALKLYQLAGKIADVYDQYLVYRPEWILSWEQGDDNLAYLSQGFSQLSAEQTHAWQPILWRALVQYSEDLDESPYHRANLHQGLLTALQNVEVSDSHNVNEKPLMVFGISAMPLQQLEVLNALAKSREVLIFWFNPSQHYWGDIVDRKTQAKAQLKAIDKPDIGAELLDVGNPLLASWGKLGRDYQDMLLSFDLQQQDCFIEQTAASLLEHIQLDINNLQFRNTANDLAASELLSNGVEYPKIEISPTDNSLQVHACHSKIRELEILHDQLLKRFNDNPAWSPADIIVMMPDVATYAPYIEGVFGAVQSDLYIPYAISDRNFAQVSPLIISFINIMKLHQSRLTLSEVLSLLEVPAVQRKFDISLQEYELIQHWLNDAGIRWGWDGKDKTRWDLPAEKQNTWLFGLQRLLAGFAMSANSLFQGHDELIAPYADIEGQQSVALGKCYSVIQVILSALNFCQQKQNINTKVTGALQLLEQLYLVEENEQIELISVRESLEAILSHQSQFTGELEQDVFVSELEQNIQEKGVGQRFLAGYINFCTLMPMRSIPFKMVCLLGMNDTDYPRQSVPMGFDLMRLAPVKRGDRSRRLDDRYLFLEALLSAREQLYLSYQGYSQKNNSALSPSILLSELLEYCQQGFALQGELTLDVEQTEHNLLKHLLVSHKLHAFELAYFDDSHKNLISFNPAIAKIAQQTLQKVETPSFFEQQEQQDIQVNTRIDLDELIEFYLNPAKVFFVNRWQSRFYPLADNNTDLEPFAFDGLDRYQINDALVNVMVQQFQDNKQLQKSGVNELVTEFRAQGLLPIGVTGDLAIQPLLQQSENIAKQMIELLAGSHRSHVDLDINIHQHTVTGRIKHIYGQNLILWRPGKLREKDKVILYLYWLCLCVSPPKQGLDSAFFVSVEKLYRLPVIDKEVAESALNNWLNVYVFGQRQVVHFYPKTAWQWLKTEDQNKTIQAFKGNQFSSGEGDEVHTQRVCPDLSECFSEFTALAESLLLPLLALEKQK
ncbi:exodeoxyribonuclease V subunit gamma [Paraglaciecola sp. L3A3]|uniref:exodeoxyribonuclease V subunit gamma n=1 Tax=Paraglaciecola sp. L3A3 TaxID=2686358 RepID=UPI00131DEBE5|nr:exodeoxyribonuclease V subunit gamma [Paraglaciecola sp. L3A3]